MIAGTSTESSQPPLRVSGLTHDFFTLRAKEPFRVLDHIDLEVAANSFVCIVGPSGCGKSTLLRMLCGLTIPDYGEVLHNGKQVTGPDASRGMVFQQDAVFPWLTVAGNIEYGLRVRGVDKAARESAVGRWANLVRLNEVLDSYPKELSGGMRKRVDLARVYANEPAVLLMDEPFGALDAQTKMHLQGELLLLWEKDRKTVAFVTHDLEEAAFLADLVVVMSAGPGRIDAVVQIDLPRPRTEKMRITDQFFGVRRQLQLALHAAEKASGL